jgi:hypothetical protein
VACILDKKYKLATRRTENFIKSILRHFPAKRLIICFPQVQNGVRCWRLNGFVDGNLIQGLFFHLPNASDGRTGITKSAKREVVSMCDEESLHLFATKKNLPLKTAMVIANLKGRYVGV